MIGFSSYSELCTMGAAAAQEEKKIRRFETDPEIIINNYIFWKLTEIAHGLILK